MHRSLHCELSAVSHVGLKDIEFPRTSQEVVEGFLTCRSLVERRMSPMGQSQPGGADSKFGIAPRFERGKKFTTYATGRCGLTALVDATLRQKVGQVRHCVFLLAG